MGSPPVSAWTLHPQLEADTSTIGDLALSRLLLANDANYPWLLLVPRCTGASEIMTSRNPIRINSPLRLRLRLAP